MRHVDVDAEHIRRRRRRVKSECRGFIRGLNHLFCFPHTSAEGDEGNNGSEVWVCEVVGHCLRDRKGEHLAKVAWLLYCRAMGDGDRRGVLVDLDEMVAVGKKIPSTEILKSSNAYARQDEVWKRHSRKNNNDEGHTMRVAYH